MKLILTGQVRGGKNNIKITRTGRRYPDPIFARWSQAAVVQIESQLFQYRELRTQPISNFEYRWDFIYTPEDNRRRDVPAILDAVFHVLENACVVADDRYIANLHFTTGKPNKYLAGMVINFVEVSKEF